MAILFPTLDVVVTAAPGTGSTSVIAACRRSPHAIDLLDELGLRDSQLDDKHSTVTDINRLVSFPWSGTIVTTTRNPFDFYFADWSRTRTRWASELAIPTSWVHRVPDMIQNIRVACDNDFGPWIDHVLGDDHRAGRQRRINVGHVDEADIVLRMEHFDVDLRLRHPRLAEEIGRLPHENRSDRPRRLRSVYTEEAAEMVASVHADDLVRFDYSFPI